MNELTFICNRLSAEIRREILDGVSYIVAPAVAIAEGVLNGELITTAEIAHHFGSWDGRPVTLGHPQGAQGFISANDPRTLSKYQVGQLFHTIMQDGKLKGELWINEILAQKSDEGRELLRRLDGGERIELSTAYFRDLEALPGTFNGAQYVGIAKNIKPDHLAVLLNGSGACSWADGCGAPRVNQKEQIMSDITFNILSEARRPSYETTTDEEWSAPSLADYIAAMPDNLKPEAADVASMSAAAKRWVAGKSLLGDPAANDFANLVFFPVVTPQGALSRRALLGRGAQADIPEGARNSAQAMARSLLESEFDMSEETAQNVRRGGLKGAWESITIALGFKDAITNNTEVVMSKQIATIMEDGRHGFTEDELKAMPESALEKLATFVGNVDEEAPDETPAPEAPPAVTLPAGFDKLLKLVELVEPEKLAALLTNADKQEQDQRAALVEAIVANTELKAEALEGWSIQQLETLNASIAKAAKPRSYAGPGVGPQANAAKTERVVMTF